MKNASLLLAVALLCACGTANEKPKSAASTPYKEPTTIAPQESNPIPPVESKPLPLPAEPQPIPATTQQTQPQSTTPIVFGNPTAPCTTPIGNAPCNTPVVAAPCGPVVTAPCGGYGYPTWPRGPIVIGNPLPGSNAQQCYKVDAYICDMENAVIGQINGFRNARGLPGLYPDFQLAFSARECSFKQAASGVPGLCSLPGRLAVMVAEFGAVRFANVQAESIAGVVSTPLPDVAVNADALFNYLVSQPVAAANVAGAFNAAGVGIVQRGNNLYLTILFAL